MTEWTLEKNVASGGIVLLGHVPSQQDIMKKRLWTEFSPGGIILKSAMDERGLRRTQCNFLTLFDSKGDAWTRNDREIQEALSRTRTKLKLLAPSVVVALGNEAAFSLVPTEWPTGKHGGKFNFGGKFAAATGIEELRGFVFESPFLNCPVVVTVEPQFVVKSYTPWRVLFSLDLKRAKDISRQGFRRPKRNVEVL